MTAPAAFVFPGQGSQHVGMGWAAFDRFPALIEQADDVLGFSLKRLCLEDPESRLRQTEFTQPALFAVSALAYLGTIADSGERPAFLAGHSLGEYVALFAAGAFDFATGVRLTRRRGELMAAAREGGMAAVIGLDVDRVEALLARLGSPEIDVANVNTPTQVVLSGARAAVAAAERHFLDGGAERFVVLNVSAAFHSRLMADTRTAFGAILSKTRFADPSIPVIANSTALPYRPGGVADELSAQITARVRWTETIQYLRARGVERFVELGPGRVLTGLVQAIRTLPVPAVQAIEPPTAARAGPERADPGAASLGSAAFRAGWNTRLAYAAGSMYKGIASASLVIRMGRAGLLGFLGTGGQSLADVESDIVAIKAALSHGEPFGANLLHQPDQPQHEDALVDLLLRLGVTRVEAAAFLKITPALVRYRLAGIARGADGSVVAPNRVLAKVSRPEVADLFLSPPPDKIVSLLLDGGRITPEQARLAREIPVAADICAEADSGGHTDQGSPYVLLPAMIRLRDRVAARHSYPAKPGVGAAGGIGTPEAALAAFVLGADFVVTGSINQCTVEAGTSDAVKDLLQTLDVQDTAYAPAGDLFELGAKVQVARKGLFFPARANKLHDLYRQFDGIDKLPEETRQLIEQRYFRRTMDAIWAETQEHYRGRNPALIAQAEANPKQRMALIFRWYFMHSTRAALAGDLAHQVDFQIHCGPALGAFNQWVRDTPLALWRDRHVDEIADRLMTRTAELMAERLRELLATGAMAA